METERNTPLTVLVVDDDEDLLILLQFKLAAEGFNPIFSPNGTKVIDIILRIHPDIVLLDIRMNGIDGGDICKKIKSNPATSATPIILFSANENIEAVSHQCGADGFINKPFNIEKFRQTFEQVLNSKRHDSRSQYKG